MGDKDHVAGLAIQIPEGMIEDVIRAQMVAAVPNPEKWVEAIVRKALEEKTDRYNTHGATKFHAAISEAIRGECEKVFQEWLVEHRQLIREAMIAQLTKGSAKRIKAIASKLADGLTGVRVYNIGLKLDDEE